MTRLRAVAYVSLIVLAGCGKTEGGTATIEAGAAAATPKLASCDRVASMSVCAELNETILREGTRALEAQCTRLRGTFTLAGCPNTAVVGSCKLATGELRKLYASGGAPFDAAKARTECDAYHGAFTAAP